MKYKALFIQTLVTAIRLWVICVPIFSLLLFFYLYIYTGIPFGNTGQALFFITFVTTIGSLPVFAGYFLLSWFSNRASIGLNTFFLRVMWFNGLATLPYTIFFIVVMSNIGSGTGLIDHLQHGILAFGGLFGSATISLLFNTPFLKRHYHHQTINQLTMDNPAEHQTKTQQQNHILYKGLLTACLILILLIPMIFVSNLVNERKERRVEVVNDINKKWAKAQTFSGPYLHIPYKVTTVNSKKETVIETESFIVLPENLEVNGKVDTEKRKRSIYNVLLYRSAISARGHFAIQLPHGVSAESISWNEIKVCIGISDFKGIEKEVRIDLNNSSYSFLPGLPENSAKQTGLSSLVALNSSLINQPIHFNTEVWLKGSETLHFDPLAGNGKFTLSSTWPSPSFDGNSLPATRKVDKDGFTATWTFNKANLPFPTIVTDITPLRDSLAFGVNLVEPADQYAKTDRASKYAILLISLCFALFFIMEIMQKKPVHPVQYLMVGVALIIFYTLLLSIGEIASFDIAYLIAGLATVSLITIYVYSHFRSAKIATYFTCMLGGIYGFVYVLLQLEDTALLVGSIGLFLILAVSMIASRRVNWYETTTSNS